MKSSRPSYASIKQKLSLLTRSSFILNNILYWELFRGVYVCDWPTQGQGKESLVEENRHAPHARSANCSASWLP